MTPSSYFHDIPIAMARKLMSTPLGQFEPTTLLAIAVATALAAVVAYRRITLHLRRRRFQLEHGCQPPPSFRLMDSIFGLAQFSGRRKAAKEHRLLQYASKNFQTLGPTWRSNVFGQEVILTIQPENIKTFLSLKFKEYGLGNRERTLGPLLGRGIFTSDGEPWAHSRAMIRPNFTRDQVADLASLERHVQALLRLLPRDDPSAVVDLQERFFQLTIDSATEFLFGQSTHTLEAAAKGGADGAADFANDFTVAQRWCAERGRVGMVRPIHDLFGGGAGPRAIKNCHAFVDRFVDEAVRYREKVAAPGDDDAKLPDEEEGNGGKRKYVFLHELARSTDDKRRLRDELLNVLLAGRDTTASLLSNMWFCIAKRPEVFARLRREVEEQLGGELPTYEQLKDLKYLKWCMNECTCPRLPPSPSRPNRLTSPSAAHPPRRARQLPPRLPGHPPPHRRRPRLQVARLRRQGHHRRLLDLRHAPPPRHLRRRRRRVPPGPLGDAPPRVGVPALQRRAPHLPGPAVRADGGGLRQRAAAAGVCQGREQGSRGVGGELDSDPVLVQRDQGFVDEGVGLAWPRIATCYLTFLFSDSGAFESLSLWRTGCSLSAC